MKEKNITTTIEVLDYDELSASERELVDMAREAAHNSYAPYSHFHVGAAILLENGVKIKGNFEWTLTR